MPGKLADCQIGKQEGELFIVGVIQQEALQSKVEIELTKHYLRGKILNIMLNLKPKNGNNGYKNGSDQRTKALSKMISSKFLIINALGLDPKADEIDLKI